jgi:hypothetical protein
MRFQVLTSTGMKMAVFCDLSRCFDVSDNRTASALMIYILDEQSEGYRDHGG